MAAATGAVPAKKDVWVAATCDQLRTLYGKSDLTDHGRAFEMQDTDDIRWNGDFTRRIFEINATRALANSGKETSIFFSDLKSTYGGRHTFSVNLDLSKFARESLEGRKIELEKSLKKASEQKRYTQQDYFDGTRKLLLSQYSAEYTQVQTVFARAKEINVLPKKETKPNPDFVKKYGNEDFEDYKVQFKLDDGTEVFAHKTVLTALSEKYKSTLKVAPRGLLEVRVENVTKESFEKYIKYLYTAQVDIANNAEALALNNLAKEDGIKDLQEMTEQRALMGLIERNFQHILSPEQLQKELTGTADQMWSIYAKEADKVDTLFRSILKQLTDSVEEQKE